MSRFTAPLRVQELDDGRTWVLLDPLVWEVGHLGSGDVVTVPAGFVTDFASVPTIGLVFTDGRTGRHTRPAVLHDWLYWAGQHGMTERPWTRRAADREFRIAMTACGVPRWRRWGMWAAVRVGGWWAWRGNRRKSAGDKIHDLGTTATCGPVRSLPAL